jgi:hypothetical protein
MSSNYPDGLSDWTPGTPWNEPEIPDEDFEITCSQSLSRTATVTTNNYIPGASGVDYESDDEGGCYAVPYHDDPDTSDTNWADEYKANGYKTPLQLIQMLKGYLEDELKKWEEVDKQDPHKWASTQVRKFKSLIEECDCWIEDETEFIEN